MAANLPRVHATVSTQFKEYVIGPRDTLDRVCARFGINKLTLLKANNLRKAKLSPGHILRIPHQTTQYALLSEKELQHLTASAKTPADVMIHTVKSGETISQIATRYGTSPKMIATWNKLKDSHRLKLGQRLTLYADAGKSNAAKAQAPSHEHLAKTAPAKGKGRQIIASRVKSKAKPKETVTRYQVKNGDSLWTIAERFDLSTDDLKKWNNLEGNQIAPGLKLIIKSKS